MLLGVSRKQDPSFFHLLPANRTETGLQAESALRSDYLLSLGKTESCEPNFKKFYLFIFGGTGSSLLQTGYSLLTVHGLLIEGLLLLQSTGFRACRLKSCGSQAWLLQGTWSLPGPGIQPVFPALAGGFLTTEPPGRSEPNLACLCFLTLCSPEQNCAGYPSHFWSMSSLFVSQLNSLVLSSIHPRAQ